MRTGLKRSATRWTPLIVVGLASLALAAIVPSAAADGTFAECGQYPLGQPDGDGGLDDLVKEHGNAVYYESCRLVLEATSDTLNFVLNTLNDACRFATGQPCIA